MNLEEMIKMAKVGDKDALWMIIKKFEGVVVKQAACTYISGYDMDDLIQIGYMSIMKAVTAFDFDKNTNFTGYVVNAIKNNFYYLIRGKMKINGEVSINKTTDTGCNLLDFLISDYDIEGEVLKEDEINRLLTLVKNLNEDERELINYVYLAEKGNLTKYAKERNINYSTCIKRRDRILKKLKENMIYYH